MLEKLIDYNTWQEFYCYKTEGKLLSLRDSEELLSFIENREYEPIAKKILQGDFKFSPPTKSEVNKSGTSRKRVVYVYPHEEKMILKLLSYLLYKYDSCLASNCYAFRKDIGVRAALSNIIQNKSIGELWCFKADISNYFNSIDVPTLIKITEQIITDDDKLLALLTVFLSDNRVISNGELIFESKGAAAGTPVSPFFANIYLHEMDEYFQNNNIIYARYSDDIIIFDTKEKLEEHINVFYDFIEKYKLLVNRDKTSIHAPGEEFSFLGFSCKGGEIDISKVTAQKLMAKMKRSTRSLRRWMLKNNKSNDYTLRLFNRKLNKKLYSDDTGHELCWARWYFPLITTDKTLKIIDRYMQQCQRYLVTGKHNKANYEKVPYQMMKDNGYRPLVAEYYK